MANSERIEKLRTFLALLPARSHGTQTRRLMGRLAADLGLSLDETMSSLYEAACAALERELYEVQLVWKDHGSSHIAFYNGYALEVYLCTDGLWRYSINGIVPSQYGTSSNRAKVNAIEAATTKSKPELKQPEDDDTYWNRYWR